MLKDELGNRFGLLLVVSRSGMDNSGSADWLCRCDCGNERIVSGPALRAGRNKSCGCASPRFKPKIGPPGVSGDRTYRIWCGMRRRCSDSATGKCRRLYYDKGIRVCERWNDYFAFLSDMGDAPDGMTIDRIDGSIGYAPFNCRWATPIEQGNNTAANRLITKGGVTHTLAEWGRITGIKPNTILYRIRRGATPEKALAK